MRIPAATPWGAVHEHAQHILALTQHIVAAAAQDHAGAFLGQLLDDAALKNEHLIAQRQLIAHGVQTVQQAVSMPVFHWRQQLLPKDRSALLPW